MNNQNLFRLIYCSRNRIQGDTEAVAAELNNILEKARANNSRRQVTGALLYNSGYFAQVLEGSLTSIEDIFERIQCDPRHSEVTVIESGPADKRLFPEWAMAFAGKRPDDQTAEENSAFQLAFDRKFGAPEAVTKMLQELVVREHEWILLDALSPQGA